MARRFTQVLDPSEVKYCGTGEEFNSLIHENEYQEEDSTCFEDSLYEEINNEDLEKEEKKYESESLKGKSKYITPEEINEEMLKLQLEELENSVDDIFVNEDKEDKVQENKNKAKKVPAKKEKKTTTKDKQHKIELTPEQACLDVGESKSKKGKNKKVEPTKEEDKSDNMVHPSVDHGNSETKQKKGRNKKQLLGDVIPSEPTNAIIEEELLVPPKKNRGKKQIPIEAHEDNNEANPTENASHTNVDSKTKKSRKGKVDQVLKDQDSSEIIHDKATVKATKHKNKDKEEMPTDFKDNSKENKVPKVKSDKDKSKASDSSKVKDTDTKVTKNKAGKAVESGEGKENNSSSDFKVKNDAKDSKEKEENINERPKRNIQKKDYTEPKALVKKSAPAKPLQSQNTESQIGGMVEDNPLINGKAKTQPKGKKTTEAKESEKSGKAEVVKKATHKKK